MKTHKLVIRYSGGEDKVLQTLSAIDPEICEQERQHLLAIADFLNGKCQWQTYRPLQEHCTAIVL